MTGQAPAAYAGQPPAAPPPVPVPPAGAARAGSHAAPAPPRRASLSLRGAGTPGVLRSLLIGLVLGSIAWGAIAAWTVGTHASAASQVVSTSEPVSLAAQGMYQSLSDADVTATTAFLTGPAVPLPMRQRYEQDISSAAADLATLRNAGASAGSSLAADLSAVSTGLPAYSGYVEQAQTYSAAGYKLTGGSFMQVASAEMHVTLLPAADAIYADENVALSKTSAQASGLPLIALTVVLALLIGYALVRGQRWLTRRTHRTVNYGLLLASGALVIATLWLAISFVAARSHFDQGIGHGSTPAEAAAQAGIAAQEGRSYQVLNLISRSGSTSFQSDFAAVAHRIGPGTGTLLGTAATSSPHGTGASAVTDASADASTWYKASAPIFGSFASSNYADEFNLVTQGQAGSSAADFTKLESDLRRAIAADQVVFKGNAASGSGAFGGLEIGVIIAALLMAAGSAWGLSRRLAEYR
ncbi:MAG TPA: hypothetical protein VMR14_13940 [Streptosporangiaceae bacterium]|jgi:hypothetical protein|nr:hypothetical protein [Streptosporangiaceae bacterium]